MLQLSGLWINGVNWEFQLVNCPLLPPIIKNFLCSWPWRVFNLVWNTLTACLFQWNCISVVMCWSISGLFTLLLNYSGTSQMFQKGKPIRRSVLFSVVLFISTLQITSTTTLKLFITSLQLYTCGTFSSLGTDKMHCTCKCSLILCGLKWTWFYALVDQVISVNSGTILIL